LTIYEKNVFQNSDGQQYQKNEQLIARLKLLKTKMTMTHGDGNPN
jgi:hypothetical protein